MWAAIKPKGREETFEDWVSNRFGKRLYNHFFKTYTEKLWGVSASEIRAEWAAQRIKGLSFFSAAKSAFFGNRGNKIKSLISEFNYPRFGPGQMWEQMTADIHELRRRGPAERAGHAAADRRRAGSSRSSPAARRSTPSHVISSLPLRTTVGIAEPEAPGEVRDAARGLRYREFLTVLLVIEGEDLFPDNWIYIHQPGVQRSADPELQVVEPVDGAQRAATRRSAWSTSASRATICGTMADDDLVEMASQEIEKLAPRVAPSKVKFGFVARVHKAYPIYDEQYAERVATIRSWLETIANLDPGRSQRAAPLQQLRPLDADRDAGRRQHPARHPPRHLGGQRRERLPRGASSSPSSRTRTRRTRRRWSSRSPQSGDPMRVLTRRAAALQLAVIALLITSPAASLAATTAKGAATSTAASTPVTPALPDGTSPFSPGVPVSPATSTAALTPTVVQGTSTSSSGGGISSSDALLIGIGAIVVLGGVCLFIWRDARRHAPIKHGHGLNAAEALGADAAAQRHRRNRAS